MLLLFTTVVYLLYLLITDYLEHVSGQFEQLLCGKGVDIEGQLNLLAIVLNIKLIKFLCCFSIQLPINPVKILIEKFLLDGNEYLFKNLIDLLKMAHLNHTICLIYH